MSNWSVNDLYRDCTSFADAKGLFGRRVAEGGLEGLKFPCYLKLSSKGILALPIISSQTCPRRIDFRYLPSKQTGLALEADQFCYLQVISDHFAILLH
jgi:hypothetical protein